MVISAYQINNVLRVYKGHLRQGRLASQVNLGNTRQTPDKISISPEAKRKAVIDKVVADIFDRIVTDGPNNEVEKQVFEKLETEYGGHLVVARQNQNELHFKEIDENGETAHSLSLEDSSLLGDKLKEIAKETVDRNTV